jgi:four helix bundle protein
MRDNPTYDKALSYSVRIVNLYKYLKKEKHEYIISDQLMRSGTSIGANISEAISAESTADFIHKLGVAQKEANETLYWLDLLMKCDYISEKEHKSMSEDCEALRKIIASIILTTKQRDSHKS